MSRAIVDRLPGPGWFRICPTCRRWLALRFVRREAHPLVGGLRTYRCKSCAAEVTFAERRPRGALGAQP